jgi:hypothetical protein
LCNTASMNSTTASHEGAPDLLNAWASTLPGFMGNLPRPGDPCAASGCPEKLKENEEVYFVVEIAGEASRYLAVCWRHIDRESGSPYPVTI